MDRSAWIKQQSQLVRRTVDRLGDIKRLLVAVNRNTGRKVRLRRSLRSIKCVCPILSVLLYPITYQTVIQLLVFPDPNRNFDLRKSSVSRFRSLLSFWKARSMSWRKTFQS